MNTGTNAASAAIACRPNWLSAPNIELSTGASATIGTTASEATIGADIPSTACQRDASAASRIARSVPTTRPIRAFVPVTSAACQIAGQNSTNCSAIAAGLGSR